MAVAKIQRVSLVSLNESKEEMMKVMQEFQGVEFIVPDDENRNYNVDVKSRAEYAKKTQNAQFALGTVRPFEKKESIAEKRKGKDTITLDELESKVLGSEWEEKAKLITSLDTELKDIRTKRKDYSSKRESLEPWRMLGIKLSDFKKLNFTVAEIGTVVSSVKLDWNAELSQTKGPLHYEEMGDNGDLATYFIIYHGDMVDAFTEIKRKYAFNTISDLAEGVPADEIKTLILKDKEIVKREAEITAELKKIGEDIYDIKLAEEYFSTLVMRKEEEENLFTTNSTVNLTGWIVEEQIPEFEKYLAQKLNKDEIYIRFTEVEKEDYDEVPTVLKNAKIVEPFEMFTEMYSLPKYGEIDPTPFLTPFQLVFFGMMMADFGYGLLLFAGTLAAKTLFNLDKGTRRFINFFYYLSFPTMVWGLIYGSAFGLELPFGLISPTEDVMTVMIISVAFGVIQLLVGLSLGTYKTFKAGEISDALSANLSWIFALVGAVTAVIGKLVAKNDMVFKIGIVVALIGIALVLFVPVITTKKSRIGAFGAGLWDVYGASGYIGDIVSYTRLMALGLSGGSIALAFNTIIAFLPFPVRITLGVVLAIGMHALNIFLSLLSAYVHSMRLQFVEFFGKFHDGGGRAFKAFKTSDKYVNIEREENIKK